MFSSTPEHFYEKVKRIVWIFKLSSEVTSDQQDTNL